MLPPDFQSALDRAVEEARDAFQAVDVAVGWKTRQNAKRQARTKCILPGYPRTTPFCSHAEARAYLASAEVTCLVCGKPYRLLPNHLRQTHGIDPNDYRAAYGIPWSFGLVCSPTAELKSTHLKAKLADPAFSATWFADAAQHRRTAHAKARQQRNSPFGRELAIQHLAKAGVVVGRWQEADFLRLLEIMKSEDRLLRDVAGQREGVPPYGAAIKWFYSTPERHQRLVDTVHELSICSQARARLFSPRVIAEVKSLREAGQLQREIAQATGLSVQTVAKLLRLADESAPLPGQCQQRLR